MTYAAQMYMSCTSYHFVQVVSKKIEFVLITMCTLHLHDWGNNIQ